MSRLRTVLVPLATLLAACGGPSIDELLPPFRAELQRLASEAAGADHIAVTGLDGWVFFGPELHHLSAGRFWGADASAVSRARRPEDADPMPAIQDFKQQLDRDDVVSIGHRAWAWRGSALPDTPANRQGAARCRT